MCNKVDRFQGRIQDFKLGGALKKIAPSGGRRENFWGISCEKSRFYHFPGAPPPGSAPGFHMVGTWVTKLQSKNYAILWIGQSTFHYSFYGYVYVPETEMVHIGGKRFVNFENQQCIIKCNKDNVFEWNDMSIGALLYHWACTKKTYNKAVGLVQSGHQYSIVFSSWYG